MPPKMVTNADGSISLAYEADDAAVVQAANAASEAARLAQQDTDRAAMQSKADRRVKMVQDGLLQDAGIDAKSASDEA